MQKQLLFSALAAGTLLFQVGCKKDDGDKTYTVPTTYNFENVSISGQKTRLAMLSELITYAKTIRTVGASALSAQKLHDLFTNSNNQFADTTLNTSGKQLRDKTADAAQAFVDEVLDSLAASSQYTDTTSTLGRAGVYMKIDGSSGYHVNANGVELAEILEKSIMGATFYYQATAVYLGDTKMSADNTTVVAGEGTALEHHWDEAFGYFGVPIDFPTNTTGILFWGKYCNSRNSVLATNSSLMNAFLKGRAAISNDDYTTRDLMIGEVRRVWELVAAATTVSYLNDAKENFTTNPAVKHHTLSEAYGFIWGLKFGGAPAVTTAQVESLLGVLGGSADPLEANFYNTTASQIQSVIDAIVGYYPALATVKDSL